MKRLIGFGQCFIAVILMAACNTTPYTIADRTQHYIHYLWEEGNYTEDVWLSIPPMNLWTEVEAGYVFAPRFYNNQRVRRQMSFLREHANAIVDVQERIHLFLYYVTAELQKRDMPLELVFLPAVESMYDPYAYSPAGASGLWQFTRFTGDAFGLAENWWHSQRRDLLASTQAAMDYLEQLYARYNNWELALAAYNAGPSRVDSAIAFNERYKRPTDYWHLRLPRETQYYVPRLIAYARLFSVEYREQLGIEDIPAIPYWVKIPNPQQISFKAFIEKTALDEEEFFLLNAEHNQWLSSPAKDFLLIPTKDIDRTRDALINMSQDERIYWMGYRIGHRENMDDIAAKFGIANAAIERVNKVDNLRSGRYLILPMDNIADINTEVLEAEPPRSIVREKQNIRHIVRSGDTLWDISRAYAISLKKLMRLNGLRSSRIRPGQKLIVAERVLVDELAVQLVDDYNRKVMRNVYYRVRRGDSLHSIAAKFNVEVNELRKWNGTKISGRYIYPGQGVRLHIDVTDL